MPTPAAHVRRGLPIKDPSGVGHKSVVVHAQVKYKPKLDKHNCRSPNPQGRGHLGMLGRNAPFISHSKWHSLDTASSEEVLLAVRTREPQPTTLCSPRACIRPLLALVDNDCGHSHDHHDSGHQRSPTPACHIKPILQVGANSPCPCCL
jgi:hypothetical protein